MKPDSREANRVALEVDAALDSGEHFVSQLHCEVVDAPGVELAIELPITPRVANRMGGLHGGLIATLIDMVAGRLANQGIDGTGTAVTNVMNIHFLAPIVAGPARAEGKVLRRGQHSVVVSVEVNDLGANRLAAVSTSGFTLVSLPSEYGDAAS